MFGAEPVIHRDNNSRNLTRKPPANGVVSERSRREKREPSAVEENNNGKRGRRSRGGWRGNEETEPEVSTGVDGDVGGLNAVKGVGVRVGFEVEEVHETAVDGAVGTASGVGEGGEEGDGEAGLPWEEGLGSCRRFGGRH